MARRSRPLTRFISDLADNAKSLTDDALDRVEDLEAAASDVARDVAGEGDDELEALQESIDELAAKVDRLVSRRRGRQGRS